MIRRRILATVVIGIAATLAAAAVVGLGGQDVATIEWTLMDRWARPAAPVAPALLVVNRDAASEARLGSGAWDRAVLARVVTSLARAGATMIGMDVALDQPSAPGRGGAASDALLSQATTAAGNVVYPITPGQPLPRLALLARGFGHTLVAPDADGVVRRVALFVPHAGRAVPAFGLALTGDIMQADRIPADDRRRALLSYADPARLTVIPFADLWTAIAARDGAALQRLVDGKIVLVLADPARAPRRTPVGSLSDGEIQAQVLNAALTGAWLQPAPRHWTLAATLALALLAAWLALTLRWWQAVLVVAVSMVGYVAALRLSPSLTGVVLAAVPPLVATLAALAGGLLAKHARSADRLRDLEGQVTRLREALVRQESAVEALDEDLEAARASAERSSGAERELLQASETLRAELAQARAQEEHTRGLLQALESELRAADHAPAALGEADQERLRRVAEDLGIVTRDPALLATLRDLERAARATLPILLAGEPGTGKELFARAAHRLSPRAARAFVAVNTAAIPAELFESELFGHVKGSFTGAVADRKGYFEQADGGTIFLDEIGELRADQQGKLLRVLQEKSFFRVGAARPTAVDVRVVAASNRDLEQGVADGWFREDLYFRLKGLVLHLPPLRERPADIAPLAQRFLDEAGAETGQRVTLSEAALRALERHDWPGNVRELQHCLRRAVALSDRSVLAPDDLRLASPTEARADTTGDAAVLACLRQHGFDMQATARALGWDRSTVTQRLKGLGFRALVDSGGDRSKAAVALAGEPALARTVEVKLAEYHEHLLRTVQEFDSAEAAITACRRRFKNLPDRHFRSLEILVRQKLASASRP
ncbi:MAG TPA: sigma 54-interacting transcriptional regulator [Methylomirabilota bacterium]|nr:sigma 54-interacting transcriptional regulator [Methylomirabilota bacterium]